LLLFSLFYRRKEKKVTKKEKTLFSLRGTARVNSRQKLLFDESAHQTNLGFQGETLTYRSVLFSFLWFCFFSFFIAKKRKEMNRPKVKIV